MGSQNQKWKCGISSLTPASGYGYFWICCVHATLLKEGLRSGYLFGVVGRIDTPCIGYVEEPDIDAFHYVEGPRQPTYRVTFYQKDLWEGYQVSPPCLG